jgi:hypothetical protein
LNFSQEFVRQNRNIWFADAGGIKNIYHFARNDGIIDNLPDGGLNFCIGAGFGGFVKLGKTSFNGLEEGKIIPNFKCPGMRNG